MNFFERIVDSVHYDVLSPAGDFLSDAFSKIVGLGGNIVGVGSDIIGGGVDTLKNIKSAYDNFYYILAIIILMIIFIKKIWFHFFFLFISSISIFLDFDLVLDATESILIGGREGYLNFSTTVDSLTNGC